jgi:two-component system sensor histidine kinase KdpD
VIIAATRWGLWPATLVSITSAVAADYFFFSPIYSLRIDDPQEVVDLLLFFVVALVSSNLASRLHDETETLRRREAELQQLYQLSRKLASCSTISGLISAIQDHLFQTLGEQTAFLALTADGYVDSSEARALPQPVIDSLPTMISRNEVRSHDIVDPVTQNVWLLGAVYSDVGPYGVVTVNLGNLSQKEVATRKLRFMTILEEVSSSLRRLDIETALKEARLALQSEILREAFQGTLSHELYSPLTTIRGSASVLSNYALIKCDDRMRHLVEAILDEAAVLNDLIQTMLSATELNVGRVKARLALVDPRDVVNAAIRRKSRQLDQHHVQVEFAEDLSLVNVDSSLVEKAFGHLLENAAKYSPTGSTISVRIETDSANIVFSVSDEGFGIGPSEKQNIGKKSFRSLRHRSAIPGTGLGFWIASTFVEANNGGIDISNRRDRPGAIASITLPRIPMILPEHESDL